MKHEHDEHKCQGCLTVFEAGARTEAKTMQENFIRNGFMCTKCDAVYAESMSDVKNMESAMECCKLGYKRVGIYQ
jgi:hypothetical protein